MKKLLWTAMIFSVAAIAIPPTAFAKESKTEQPKPAKVKAAKKEKAKEPTEKCCEGNKKTQAQMSLLGANYLTCPQYPLMLIEEDPEIYLYYAFTYVVDETTTECPEPGADYCFGNFLWPMTCFDNCPNSPLKATGDKDGPDPFPGLNAPITLLHEMTTSDPFDVKPYENKLPPGMARASIRKAPLPEDKTFLRYRPDGVDDELCFKCFCLDPATSAPDSSDHILVGLELNAADSRKVADSAASVRKVKNLLGDHAYVVELKFGDEEVRQVLLLRTK